MLRARWLRVAALLAATGCAADLAGHYDTIVVGLGAAGAAAAGELARAGRRVLALEAQGRVGGRVWTRDFGDGVVEVGAEWIHGTESSSVYNLAVANHVPVAVQQFDDSVGLRHADGRAASALEVELVNRAMGYYLERTASNDTVGDYVTDQLSAYVREQHPASANDSSLLRTVLRFAELAVGAYEGCSSWREVGAGSPYRVLGGPETASWGRKGYRTLFDILLNKYNGGPGLPTLDVKLDTEVTSIRWSPELPAAEVTAGGRNYSADSVIVTVSLGVLKERHASLFSPPLPAEKVRAIEAIPMGTVGKVILWWERPWWGPGLQALGVLWAPEEEAAVPEEQRWITRVYSAAVPMGSSNTMTLWTIGNTTKLVEALPAAEVRARCVELLQRAAGPGVTVPPPAGMIRSTWWSNPFTRGTYSFYGAAEGGAGARAALAAALGRVRWAGEATDRAHFSTVHGALDSGRREARRLLQDTHTHRPTPAPA